MIRVENLSKQYRIGAKVERARTLSEAVGSFLTSPLRNLRRLQGLTSFREDDEENVLWALKDISFEVNQGEVVGIIGRNGAGKSTLLKVLSRITPPSHGRVSIGGRVSSLLEVGTGFHPELSGRENIYLNGTILGMRKAEVDRKFDEIVDFSGVEKFIDTPVKRYSSGMSVRLAFSVAAHLEPEVLIVDEVLAVGDMAFQKKCLGKMETVAGEGRTVVIVSHQLDMVRNLCKRTILLEDGKKMLDGASADVIDSYLNSAIPEGVKPLFEVEEDSEMDIQIVAGRVLDAEGNLCANFDIYDKITLEIDYHVRSKIIGPTLGFEVYSGGVVLFASFQSDEQSNNSHQYDPGSYRCRMRIPSPLLKPGRYYLVFSIGVPRRMSLQRIEQALIFDVEMITKAGAYLSYSADRPGTIAVPIVWEQWP